MSPPFIATAALFFVGGRLDRVTIFVHVPSQSGHDCGESAKNEQGMKWVHLASPG
jgi:hypothetical protein